MITVATNLAPREQHLAYLVSLYGLREQVEGAVMVGALNRSAATEFMALVLKDEMRVQHVNQDGLEPLGVARRALVEQAAAASTWWGTPWVLFLDDDCVLLPSQLFRMREMVGGRVCCVAYQWEYRGREEDLQGRPAFDFTCALVPSRAVHQVAADQEFMDLFARLNQGGEFLVFDWWLRKEGYCVNILPDHVLHLYVKDGYKVWASVRQAEWNEVMNRLAGALTVREAEVVMHEYGFLEEEDEEVSD